MAFTLRSVKVAPNSATLEEARHQTFEFFRSACRSIPTIMEIYSLEDVVTPSQLRSSISYQIRKNGHITNPKVFSNETSLVARCRRVYAHAHDYHINSISNNR